MPITYIPNGALHHLLDGIKTVIAKAPEAYCTRTSLNTWVRLHPCAAEPLELQPLLDQLAADRHIEVTAIGANGLSADNNTNTRIALLGTGLLTLSRLNIKRAHPTKKGEVAGRKAELHGHPSPFDKPPVQRAGADEFRAIPSRTDNTSRQYDASQGLGAAL
jgi:hypothetical protein